MELIAFSGYARSGKDTAAAVLVEEYGYRRIAFADKLRDVLYALDPIVYWDYNYEDSQYIQLHQVIDKYGWNGYKDTAYGQEIRRLLQRLGTEAGRQTLWDSIWVDAAFKDIKEGDKIVITDCRFPNEAQAVKDRGGKVVRIQREGIGPANQHASEISLDKWPFDAWLDNRQIDDFRETVRNTHRYFYEV